MAQTTCVWVGMSITPNSILKIQKANSEIFGCMTWHECGLGTEYNP